MCYQKKGFTLAELLVVVMVIGILGMAIVPKFNKMFLSRQTTEAEDILGAIRQEQVLHCMEGEGYKRGVANLRALDSLQKVGAFAVSKYFKYEILNSGMGAQATNLSGNGDLRLLMPSIEDGRICCAAGCDALNKDYPFCGNLENELKEDGTAITQDSRCIRF